VGHVDAACEEHLFHVAITQGEAVVEPDSVADNLAWKAVIFVALRVGGRRHVWLPIEVPVGFCRIITGGIMSRGRKKGQELDKTGGCGHHRFSPLLWCF
jgi:hypothetical protein